MDRANLGRWLLIAAGVFLLMTFMGNPFSKGSAERQPLSKEVTLAAATRLPEQLCEIKTDEFHAQLSSRSASVKHFWLTLPKYMRAGKPTDLSTTPDYEPRRQLRFDFRNPAAKIKPEEAQVDFDLLDYELGAATGKACEFTYKDAKVEIQKTFRATGRPYELSVDTKIKNLADRPLRHAATVHSDAWRLESEVKGGMFRVSPLVTHVECVAETGKTTRKVPGDFEPDDFKDAQLFPRDALSQGDWLRGEGKPAVAAVSNAYFSHAIVPRGSPVAPICQMQIEDRYDPRLDKSKDPNAGAMYRAELAYAATELAPGQDKTYSLLSYVGPKERSVLAHAGGGNTQLLELIDLGFFSIIAKVLVGFLLKVYSVIPNWGIAIIVLTLTARTLLFPLSVPGIRNMIRMRELKPEMDALNEKFKNDAQAKGLAQMELWRKHNVNPLKGCLPQLASMPVWFALYTTLQTAVELYNIPFLWFPDLSASDPIYVLPFIIGGTSFLQQKMMPMQQGDPAQQKMMLYFMPAMFTVFMLFLPAGLGVYMFTNGVLGILQQQAVEWHARRAVARSGGPAGEIKVKVVDKPSPGSKQGKGSGGGEHDRRSRGSEGRSADDGSAKLEGDRLLGKGKA
jgi:YidC/Oxa1 family membrane protein insertase